MNTMRKLFIITLAIVSAVISNCAFAQQQGFINVGGENLNSKLATARQQAPAIRARFLPCQNDR